MTPDVAQTLGDDLKELAEDQYTRRVTLTAPRGEIFDRDGRPLAVSVPAWSVVVRPHLVEDKVVAADALAKALGIARNEVLSKIVSEAK